MGLKKFFKGLFKSSLTRETAAAKPVSKAAAEAPVKAAAVAVAATSSQEPKREEAPKQEEEQPKVEHAVEEVQDIKEIDEIKDRENVQVIPEEAAAGTAEGQSQSEADLDSDQFEEIHTQEAQELEKAYRDISEEANTRIGRDDPFVFGQRKLENEDDVWNHNAWDNVELTEEQIKELQEKIEKQKEFPVKDFDKKLVNENPAKYWDLFYKNNKENFFKDRKWLQIEFPSLYEATKADAGEKVIFEIGCGAGNTMFPILSQNENKKLRIHGSDFSPRAVELVKNSEHFSPEYASASVWDLANSTGELPEGIEENSVDIAIMIFVFSALSPKEWDNALNNLSKILKPGGKILFRDYGRYDLAQVRFKKNRLLDENFYIRGDNTRVYFFTEEELREIFGKRFIENRIGMDRRLIVNRKRQVKMYRCWLQAVFDVPTLEQSAETDTEAASVAAVEEITPATGEATSVAEAAPAVEEAPTTTEVEAEAALVVEESAVEAESEPVVEAVITEEAAPVVEETTAAPAEAEETKAEEPTVEASAAATEEEKDASTEEATGESEEKESTPTPAATPAKSNNSKKNNKSKKKKKKGKK